MPQEVHRLSEDASHPLLNMLVGPRGRLALVSDDVARWAVYDLESGWARVSRRWTRHSFAPTDPPEWQQGFDPTGHAIFVASSQEICVADLARDTSSCLRLGGHDTSICSIAALARPDLLVFVAAVLEGTSERSELRAWVPGQPRSRTLLTLPDPGDFDGGVLTSDSRGSRLVLSDGSDTLLIDPTARRIISRLDGVSPGAPAFDPTGRRLVVTARDALEIRDARTGEPVHRISTEDAPASIAWSDDGSLLAFCADEGQARRVRVESGEVDDVEVSGCPNARLVVSAQGVRAQPALLSYDRETGRLQVGRGGHGHLHRTGHGELSLWRLILRDDRVETHRRGAAESWGRDGIRSLPESIAGRIRQSGQLGSSPSGRVRLRWDDGRVTIEHDGGDPVPVQDLVDVSCEENADTLEFYCSTTPVFSPDETTFVLTAPHHAATYEVASGRRLGLIQIGRIAACDPPCGAEDDYAPTVCVNGECQYDSEYYSRALVSFGPSGQRLIVASDDRDTYLVDLSGHRLATLANPMSGSDHDLHQVHAFSSDGDKLAFARLRSLSIRGTQDGAVQSEVTLPQPLQRLRFSEDGASLAAVTVRNQLLRIRVEDGSVVGTRDLDGLRDLSIDGALAAICRDGLLHLLRVDSEQERGPLGRCPPGGHFVFGQTDTLVGYIRGTLARVHRTQDGEVLNLRSVSRAMEPDLQERSDPPMHLAFTDSGLFEAVNDSPADLIVREGAPVDGELLPTDASPHLREGLVAAFFSGAPLPPPAP